MIVTDKALIEPFPLKMSANAWWNDIGKVRSLIWAFKMGYDVQQSCVIANISRDQYYYFLEKHPEFSSIKERLEIFVELRAKDLVVRDIVVEGNVRSAWWWLNRYEKIDDEIENWRPDPSDEFAFCANCGEHIVNSGRRAKSVMDNGAIIFTSSELTRSGVLA